MDYPIVFPLGTEITLPSHGKIIFGKGNDFYLKLKCFEGSRVKVPELKLGDKSITAEVLGILFEIPEIFDLINAIDLSNNVDFNLEKRIGVVEDIVKKVIAHEAGVNYCVSKGERYSEPFLLYEKDLDKIPEYIDNGLMGGFLTISFPDRETLRESLFGREYVGVRKRELTKEEESLISRLEGGPRISCKGYPIELDKEL